MSMSNKITVYNNDLLIALKGKFPQKWDSLKFNNKEKWLTKEDFPTYNQLAEISKAFNIPFGYLFLKELPKKKLPIPHFRTDNNIEEFSDELYDTVMMVSKLQIWAKEILEEWGHSKLLFTNKYNLNHSPKEVAIEMKKILGLERGWASMLPTWTDVFKFLVEKFEDIGIFVVINGVVGNNTHRCLSVEEFRGFVLYDDVAPFVFINNNDFISAKIFTLMHEFAHILIGKSASFDLRNLTPANNSIEKFCDQCTAEFLVPENEIAKITRIDYEQLAKQFKVSQIVIARRLLDVGKIRKSEFINFYNSYLENITKSKESKGGCFYNTAKYRYSKRFLKIIRDAITNKTILYRDAYQLLSLKTKTMERILNKSVS